MNKRTKRFLIITTGLFWSWCCFAASFIDVFNQALRSDPSFKAAEAQWLAATQLLPISRSYLFPHISANGVLAENHVNQTFIHTDNFWQTSQQYALALNQTIFDFRAWAGLASAKAQVKQARATYDAAAENLIIRVATAYFNVLQAYDRLQTTLAQKQSLAQQLQQTKEQFKYGLIPITGVDQVTASYDATVAQEIADKNNVSNRLEELRGITGVFYTDLAGINKELPLIPPIPHDINAWVAIAKKQNYNIKAAYYAMVTAKENVTLQQAGHYPTIQGQASYTYSKQDPLFPPQQFVQLAPLTTQTGTFAVQVNLPIYEGGLINAQTRQASYQYAQASAQMEQTFRNSLTQTTEAYLGVISGISKIKADRQAVASNQSSFGATKSSYTVGNSTIVDVLQQQSSLHATRTTYTADQYNYLLSLLNLKQAAGILSEKDILLINSWLTKHINFSAFKFDNNVNFFLPLAEEQALYRNNAVVKASKASSSPVKNR